MGTATGTKAAKDLSPVLCVDLDGTLLCGNVLWECILDLLNPALSSYCYCLFGRSWGARPSNRSSPLAHKLMRRSFLIGRRFLIFRQTKKSRAPDCAYDSRRPEVATRSPAIWGCLRSSRQRRRKNLKGASKGAFLAQHFAQNGFEYVGRCILRRGRADKARALMWSGTEDRAKQAAAVNQFESYVSRSASVVRTSCRTWINALRGHHWAKNLLLFLPLALSTIRRLILFDQTSWALCCTDFAPLGSTS